MMEFGLFPSFVTTRQINVLLRPCHSRLIAPCAVSLWIFAQPCGRPGRWCSVGIKSKRRSCGSVMIFSRSDPRPVVMTWITVCTHLGSTGNHLFCNVCLEKGAKRGLQATSGALRKHRYNPFQGAERHPAKCRRF